ncbi:beta-ketoacyl synthase [Escherichia phage IMM-001]|nr:beta-ketoacyl synthase [Escherichia phage IMM-001]
MDSSSTLQWWQGLACRFITWRMVLQFASSGQQRKYSKRNR